MAGEASTSFVAQAIFSIIIIGGLVAVVVENVRTHQKLDHLTSLHVATPSSDDSSSDDTVIPGSDDSTDDVIRDLVLTLSTTCDDYEACTADYLDPYGTCVNRNKANGATCSNVCYSGTTTCDAGDCVGTAANCVGQCVDDSSDCPDLPFKVNAQINIDDNDLEYNIRCKGWCVYDLFVSDVPWESGYHLWNEEVGFDTFLPRQCMDLLDPEDELTACIEADYAWNDNGGFSYCTYCKPLSISSPLIPSPRLSNRVLVQSPRT
jgi:hypothetical protein